MANRKIEKDKVQDVLNDTPYLKEQFNDKLNNEVNVSELNWSDYKVKIHWKCPICGHEWESTMYSRTHGSSCPHCHALARGVILKQRALDEYGILDEVHPEVMNEWSEKNILDAHELTSRSRKVVLWKCSKCGTEYKMTPFDKIYRHKMCPACSEAKKKHDKFVAKMENLYGKKWREYVNSSNR